MASPQAAALANYIQQQLQAGYTEVQLRQYLAQYGYAPQVIEEAFSLISRPKLAGGFKISISPKLLMLSAGVLVGVLLIILLIALLTGGPKISLYSSSTSSEIDAGSTFTYTLSFGDTISDPVTVDIRLLSSSGSVVASDSRSSSPGSDSMQVSFDIPDTVQSGSYYLRSSIAYKGSQFRDDLPLKIIGKPEEASSTGSEVIEDTGDCFDNIMNGDEGGIDCGGRCSPCQSCPDSCDDNDKCTEEICSPDTNYECVYSPIIPCCGNDICESLESSESCAADCTGFIPPANESEESPEEIIDRVKSEDMDPNDAGNLCNSLPESSQADECFDAIAAKYDNPLFCVYIQSDGRKDNCYMINFVLKGKSTPDMCDNVVNKYLKKNCESLLELSENYDVEGLVESNFNQTTS